MATHTIISLALIMSLGLAGVFFSVEAVEPRGLLLATGFVSLLLAVVGIRTRAKLQEASASRSAVESASAFYMGLVWLWGAIALFTVYVFQLSWREWPHFTAAFAIAGALSLGFAALLRRDAAAGKEDETLLTLGRKLCLAQLVGMIITLVGLMIDPDKEFLYIKDNDWAGNGIFLFGALALALISAHALRSPSKSTS